MNFSLSTPLPTTVNQAIEVNTKPNTPQNHVLNVLIIGLVTLVVTMIVILTYNYYNTKYQNSIQSASINKNFKSETVMSHIIANQNNHTELQQNNKNTSLKNIQISSVQNNEINESKSDSENNDLYCNIEDTNVTCACTNELGKEGERMKLPENITEWSEEDVLEWLRFDVNLEEYVGLFSANEINGEVLNLWSEKTGIKLDEELKIMGIGKYVSRVKLRNAIEKLKENKSLHIKKPSIEL